MVHVPAVVDDVYVVTALPLESVVTVPGAKLPQEAPLMVNITGSADTLAVPFLTLAVMVEVLTPLAAMLVGLAVAVTVNGVPGAGLLV
jgi:hypothetical protein